MISEKLSTDSRRMLQNGVPQFVGFCRCTPCRQRRGKGPGQYANGARSGMHPVQAAPRQRLYGKQTRRAVRDAPRAGSAEAKRFARLFGCVPRGCTPCRQRRGKGRIMRKDGLREVMHPVQAAPRQRSCPGLKHVALLMHPVQAAPRQSVMEVLLLSKRGDAPRAGSAEAKLLTAPA